MSNGEKIVVIRVRGLIGISKDIKDGLNMLGLYKKNYCVIVPSNPSYLGMINKVKDYVTWGNIDDETEKLLLKKRGKRIKDKEGKDVMRKFFRLNSPRKGFGRKGIKLPFSVSGALGDRKEKINDLIKRMI